MATRYHVNPKTGEYSICKAKTGKCPFGGTTGRENHFSTEAAARAVSENMNALRQVKKTIRNIPSGTGPKQTTKAKASTQPNNAPTMETNDGMATSGPTTVGNNPSAGETSSNGKKDPRTTVNGVDLGRPLYSYFQRAYDNATYQGHSEASAHNIAMTSTINHIQDDINETRNAINRLEKEYQDYVNDAYDSSETHRHIATSMEEIAQADNRDWNAATADDKAEYISGKLHDIDSNGSINGIIASRRMFGYHVNPLTQTKAYRDTGRIPEGLCVDNYTITGVKPDGDGNLVMDMKYSWLGGKPHEYDITGMVVPTNEVDMKAVNKGLQESYRFIDVASRRQFEQEQYGDDEEFNRIRRDLNKKYERVSILMDTNRELQKAYDAMV